MTTNTKNYSNTNLIPVKSGEMKILLVDDDREDTLYLSELLEESFKDRVKLNLESTTNFEEAMTNVTANEYDLVILDFKLGYLNGLDLQKAINKERKDLPVVFVTGQGNERVAVSALKHGALDYLIKDELSVAVVNKVLERVFNKHGKTLRENTKKLFAESVNQEKGKNYKFLMSLDKMMQIKNKSQDKFLTKVAPISNFSYSLDLYFRI